MQLLKCTRLNIRILRHVARIRKVPPAVAAVLEVADNIDAESVQQVGAHRHVTV